MAASRPLLWLPMLALAAVAADPEPSYNGRLLSDWLADQYASSGVTVVGAPDPPREAIRAMGTNAIPTLLKWISYEWSPSEQSRETGEAAPRWHRHTLSTEERADSTPGGFAALGAVARPAIPELTRLARTSSRPKRAERCAVALTGIGPEAIPSLLSLATNGPPWTRYWAVYALEYFARKPEGVQIVPVLIKCLSDTNTDFSVAGPAQRALIAVAPAVAVLALTNALQSSSAQTRLAALGCLFIFEGEDPRITPAVVPLFRAAMRDSDREIRDMATNALRHMGGWELVGEQWVRPHGTSTLHGITSDFFTNSPPH